MDPLAEKYYPISPYVYCANNPINNIDPFGLDVWEINNKGKIVNRIDDETQDAFYMVAKDKDGNYQRTYTTDAEGNNTYNSIAFEYGTVSEAKGKTLFRDATCYSVTSESAGADLFKFFSDNTKVEFGLINTKSNGSTVMTNHSENSVSASATALQMSEAGGTVTSVVHNHSNNSNPSGFRTDDTSGDKFAANLLLNSHGNQVERYLYQSKTNSLVMYNEKRIIGTTSWKLLFSPSMSRKVNVPYIRSFYPGAGLPPR
jgi:hypothetical protein